jgi:outer membrane lipoprotein carrier protein
LISTAVDLRALQADFVLTAAPDKDGLSWVVAAPKSKDNQVQTVQSVRIGFRDGTLAALDILDSFGQNSRMSFASFQANVTLDTAAFQFNPPAGADVVRQ